MEQNRCEEGRQDVLDFKCKKIIRGVEKSSASSPPTPLQKSAIIGADTEFASYTPEKINKPLYTTKHRDGSIELPEKYKTIVELFDRMNCSLRLLSLRKKLPTFQNICAMVEVLTNRKFSRSHLAQMKYILPEALQIDKILIHDEKSLCMKPSMKITLVFDVIEGHQQNSAFIALRQLFSSRILNFINTHPEDCDIPEAKLLEQCNQRNQVIVPEALHVDALLQSQLTYADIEALSNPSHLHSSFSRHFSRKTSVKDVEDTQIIGSPVAIASDKSDSLTSQSIESGQQKDPRDLCSETESTSIKAPQPMQPQCDVSHITCGSPFVKPTSVVDSLMVESGQHKYPRDLCGESTSIKAPQSMQPQCDVNHITCRSPFVKPTPVDDSLMVETPAQSTPKRSIPRCDNNLKSIAIKQEISCQKPAKRYLDFLDLDDGSTVNSTMDGQESCKAEESTTPKPVGTKGNLTEEIVTRCPTVLQTVEGNNDCTATVHKLNQTGLVMRQEMPARLPNLVALIHHIFQSADYSSITKEELVHKIIMSDCDILERREVEEQIEHLEKQAPDWISRRLTLSGDVLYKITKESDLDTVCARLL